jgi:nitrous oxidase accessory protein NosD
MTPRVLLLSAAALVAGLLSVLAPTADAFPSSCSVRDVTAHTAKTGDLQQAIDSATAGDTLEIKGRCVGNFTIIKNLSLRGKSHAALDGNASGTVLTITGVAVALRDVTVTNGNKVGNGGGIWNQGGAVTLEGRAQVTGNYANDGGGISNEGGGSVTLNDHAQVNGNNAIGGGGIISDSGSVTLQDHAQVNGNTATYGGGIDSYGSGTVAVKDRAQVAGNTPDDCEGC